MKTNDPRQAQKIGKHNYRVLTDEEARQKYGASFFFVGGVQKHPTKPADASKSEKVGNETG